MSRHWYSPSSDRMEDVSYFKYHHRSVRSGQQQQQFPGTHYEPASGSRRGNFTSSFHHAGRVDPAQHQQQQQQHRFFDDDYESTSGSRRSNFTPIFTHVNSTSSAINTTANLPIQGHGQSVQKSAGTLQPKHFKTPPTCYYWATNGCCTKSDEDCHYAHHNTGIVAEAPVKFGSGITGRAPAQAGPAVTRRMQTLAERERAVEAREQIVATREEDLHGEIQEARSSLKAREEKVAEQEKDLEKRVDTALKVFAATNQGIYKALGDLEKQVDPVQRLNSSITLTYSQKYQLINRLIRRTTTDVAILHNQMELTRAEATTTFPSFLRKNRFAVEEDDDDE